MKSSMAFSVSSIGVRRNKGHCSIMYRQADTRLAFKLSNTETHTNALNERTLCDNDWSNVLFSGGGINGVSKGNPKISGPFRDLQGPSNASMVYGLSGGRIPDWH